MHVMNSYNVFNIIGGDIRIKIYELPSLLVTKLCEFCLHIAHKIHDVLVELIVIQSIARCLRLFENVQFVGGKVGITPDMLLESLKGKARVGKSNVRQD
jgi:hypothetical protein